MHLKRIVLVAALAPQLGACIPSYGKKPALTFDQIPYRGLNGRDWPLKELSVLARRDDGQRRPLRIRYVELGQVSQAGGKRTLLFVHGLGSYLKFWRHQLDHFASQGFHVIAVDLPGYGKSEKPADFPYTMEAMAEVVLALVRTLKLDRPVVIGHSMGGQTALSLAIRYPAEVGGLVLVSPAGFEQFSRKERAWFKKVVTTSLIKEANEYAIWGSVRRNNFYRWKDSYRWLVEERVRLAKCGAEFDRYAYANVRSIAGLADNAFVRESVTRVKAPTLIVYGDKDRLIPNPFMHGGFTRNVMKGGRRITGAKLVELPRCGHTLQIDCSAPFNETMAGFLRQLPASLSKPAPNSRAASQPSASPPSPAPGS